MVLDPERVDLSQRDLRGPVVVLMYILRFVCTEALKKVEAAIDKALFQPDIQLEEVFLYLFFIVLPFFAVLPFHEGIAANIERVINIPQYFAVAAGVGNGLFEKIKCGVFLVLTGTNK